MTARKRGLAAALLLTLCGCVGPMGQREAESRALHELSLFCRDSAPCGAVHLIKSQKIANRWLVDFDAPASKYAVVVDNGGNAKVSVWDKTQAR